MSKSLIGQVILVLLLLGLAGMLLSVSSRFQVNEPDGNDQPVDNINDDEVIDIPKVIIEASHQFIDGEHLIAGEIDLPTPCHRLIHDVLIRESYPEQVVVQLTTQSNSEICAQVIAPTKFEVRFQASPEAVISATFNGEPASFNFVAIE